MLARPLEIAMNVLPELAAVPGYLACSPTARPQASKNCSSHHLRNSTWDGPSHPFQISRSPRWREEAKGSTARQCQVLTIKLLTLASPGYSPVSPYAFYIQPIV